MGPQPPRAHSVPDSDSCSSIRVTPHPAPKAESGSARARDSPNRPTPERSAAAARNQRKWSAAAGDREGDRANRNDAGEERSGLLGPRAAQRPDSSGRACGFCERGPCGPPGATEGSGTGGRNPQSGCSATPTGRFAAVEALAAARWAERGAGALHGGRLDVTPLMRGNAGDGGLDARRVRARSFAPTLSARPDRTPPDGVSEAHRRRGRRRRDSGSALARRVPLGSWRAPQLGARRESRPCVFGLVGAGVVF